MKNYLFPVLIILYGLLSADFAMNENFKSRQLKYPRVQQAWSEKEQEIKLLLQENHIDRADLQIFIRAFKKQRIIELWGKNKKDKKYLFLKEYPFCSFSGNLGPKRKQGDNQIPEGFYSIDRFNPNSNFYLSLGINYPNRSDKILGDKENPGGDIFIHGNCVTIGCIPITDDLIKELYIFAVEARNNGQQNIPVHIFPCRLDPDSFDGLIKSFKPDKSLLMFWTNLKEGYDYFDTKKLPPEIRISGEGKYHFE
jgi:murein L,D-transpeptidase YafK